MTTANATRRIAPAGMLFAIAGIALFVYFVRRAGFAQTLDYIRALGAGFLLVLLISAARPVLRALAWTRCFESGERLPFRDALAAYLIGDACGNLVPAGLVLTEPVKVALVRERVSVSAGFAAIAIENLFYSLSVMLFLFAGAAALLLSFPLPTGVRHASVGALIVIALLLVAAYLIARRRWRFASWAMNFARRFRLGRESHAERVREIEDRVYNFYSAHSRAILPILLLEACFHLAGVIEVYATLHLISDAAVTPLAAFVLETTNRFVVVVFKFIPLRVGIDEAGAGLLARVLGLTVAAGVALAIIRKARILCWTAIGVLLLLRRGLTLRRVRQAAREAQGARNSEASV